MIYCDDVYMSLFSAPHFVRISPWFLICLFQTNSFVSKLCLEQIQQRYKCKLQTGLLPFRWFCLKAIRTGGVFFSSFLCSSIVYSCVLEGQKYIFHYICVYIYLFFSVFISFIVWIAFFPLYFSIQLLTYCMLCAEHDERCHICIVGFADNSHGDSNVNFIICRFILINTVKINNLWTRIEPREREKKINQQQQQLRNAQKWTSRAE